MRPALNRLFKWLCWSGLLLALAGLLALYLSFQDMPLVARPTAVSAADVERANNFLRRNDPRKTPPGTLRTLIASEQEVNLLLNQLSNRYLPSATQVVLRSGTAAVRASMQLQRSPFGPWLNVDAFIHETSGLPAVDQLRIGRLPVPGWAANLVLRHLATQLNATAEGQLAHDLVKSIRMAPFQLQVVYEWRDDTYNRLVGTLLPEAEQARLKVYAERLALLSEEPALASQPAGVSLAQLLPPLFKLAQERSAAPGSDPVKENRAALLTLALHASGRGLGALVPAALTWRQPRPMLVTLLGREDFPQHFLVSTVLAIEGGGPLSDAIGVYKEVADSRGGSGFSFNDIAADRAGTRLGLLAKNDARRLQARLAAGVQEAEFMPDVSDLPEFLRAEDFQKTYGGVGAPAYRAMLAQIEQRLDTIALLALK